MSEWMIYGANGYTGRLILNEAVKRGLKPIVAGRNSEAVHSLANQHHLPGRAFDLRNDKTIASALNGVKMVLHCAGPFSQTSDPMLEACLKVGAHYLDITGEVDVFAHAHAQDARAKEAGIVVMPGCGFDVVPTDCLAALLKREMPDASELVLAFEAGGGPSMGTALSGVEGLGKGGRIRRNGVLTRVPLAYKSRDFFRDGQARSAMTIPWGDVFTSFISTGIPDVEVYMTLSPASIKRAEKMRKFQFAFGWSMVQKFLKSKIEKSLKAPSDETRQQSQSFIWGEVRNPSGKLMQRQLQTPNGYDLTVTASLSIVEHLLKNQVAGGYYTPSLLMGADHALKLPGVQLFDRLS